MFFGAAFAFMPVVMLMMAATTIVSASASFVTGREAADAACHGFAQNERALFYPYTDIAAAA